MRGVSVRVRVSARLVPRFCRRTRTAPGTASVNSFLAASSKQIAMKIPLFGRPWRPMRAWFRLRRHLPPALPALLLALPLLLAFSALLGHKLVSARQFAPPPATGAWDRWYRGGFADKKIIVWGNSTVSHADIFFAALAAHAAPGGALEGLPTAPRIDNLTAAQIDHNGRIHAFGSLINYGNRGASLRMMTGGSGDVYFRIDHVIAARPDMLIIRGPLINDVRMGETNTAQATALLAAALDKFTAELPQTAILLLTENSMLTTDQGGYGFVRPNSAAQRYTRIMHRAVMAMAGRYPQVKVFDLMAAEYGLRCRPSSLLMHDQLHPNAAGQQREADLVAHLIGRRRP